MMRSLYSGVSGLRNHQTRMDVIANNIANVNTVGYKSSRVVFQDVFSQTSRAAGAPGAQYGGTNPMQIGLGVKTAAIDVQHTQSALQVTDNTLDVAISGDGFFVVNTADDTGLEGNERYTRAGNFYLDNAGFLVNTDGLYVQGWTTDDASSITESEESFSGGPIDLSEYTGISIDSNGVIWGLDENSEKVAIAVIAIATFVNPPGLEKQGNSLYDVTPNSGTPVYNVARTGAAGSIEAGRVEMSNVDLSAEFTDMIITQRGFQANSRVITTSDTLLEELINLKR
jgi:flagellar hook protein FlgE